MRTERIREWTTCEFPGLELGADDRERLRGLRGGALEVDELRSGLRLRTHAQVGVVQLDAMRLEIVPKLAGGITRVGQMIQWTLGVGHLDPLDFPADIDPEGRSLVDVIVALLVRRCEDVLRRGLVTEHREHDDLLPFVRGRFLADRQVLRRFGRLDRLHCRFDERTADTRDNRLLFGALTVGSRIATDPEVRGAARRLCTLFDERCAPMRADDRVALSYHRLNAHYRPAHVLAQLVLDAIGLDHLFDAGPVGGYSFLLDMNQLFEAFVERLVTHVVGKHGTVKPQSRDATILVRGDTGKKYATVIPDLLVEHGGGARVPIDAKYKRYDHRKLARDDLDQAFLYGYAYATGGEAPLALLIHPTEAATTSFLPLEVRSKAGRPPGRLHVVGIPIGACLDELAAGAGAGPNLTALASRLGVPVDVPEASHRDLTRAARPWVSA